MNFFSGVSENRLLRQSMVTISHALIMPIAFMAGSRWPDIDQLIIRVIGHRSILTHSALLPLIFLLYTYFVKTSISRLAARRVLSWFCLGVGAHLFADLFVKAWAGFALIKFPFGYGSLGDMSRLWIFTNALVCIVISEWIMRDDKGWGRIIHASLSFVGFVLYFLINEKKFWTGLIIASGGIFFLVLIRHAWRRLTGNWLYKFSSSPAIRRRT